MSDQFAVGDVVQLKSGGTQMTVEKTAGDVVTCVWMDGKKQQRGEFAAGTLKKYERAVARPVVSQRWR